MRIIPEPLSDRSQSSSVSSINELSDWEDIEAEKKDMDFATSYLYTGHDIILKKWEEFKESQFYQTHLKDNPAFSTFFTLTLALVSIPVLTFVSFVAALVALTFLGFLFVEGTLLTIGVIVVVGIILTVGVFLAGFFACLYGAWFIFHKLKTGQHLHYEQSTVQPVIANFKTD